jgi:hypothetical protein
MENNSPSSNNQEKREDSIFSDEEFSMEGYDKHVRQARNTIFVAAGLLFVSTLFFYLGARNNDEYIWIDITIWASFIIAFILLGLWTKRKPYYAIIGAIILYTVFVILNARVDISTIYSGIIFKI